MTFKNPVPDDRTVVPGTWSDILDNQLASFETSDRGNTANKVFIQDQTTEALDVPFLLDLGSFTLDGDTTRDSRFFDANAGHNINVGETIELADSNSFMQAKVLGVISDAIEIDTPINHVYLDSTSGSRATDDMRVDGSSTPKIFSVLPLATQSGDMTRVVITIESANAIDFTKFGSIAALTNGIVLRVKRANGDFRNHVNFKTNGEFIEKAFDFKELSKSGGGGFGIVMRLTYAGPEKHGVAVRLDGELGEEWQAVVQDNLLVGLLKVRITAGGHELQE